MPARYWLLFILGFLLTEVFFYSVQTKNISTNIGNIDRINEELLNPVFEKETDTETKKIFFVGDLMLARNVERRLAQTGVWEALSGISEFWQGNYVVANFESAIPRVHQPTPDFNFQFSTKADFIPELRTAGVTHVSLANNHSLDFGPTGYLNTATVLQHNAIQPFGHPQQYASSSISYLDTGEHLMAVIGLNQIGADLDLESLSADMAELSKITDLQIVYIHWGNEYIQNQSVKQREVASVLAASGVDVVIGHHPHVIQGIEQINNTIVFYSLGNFLFDQYFSEEVQIGLMLALNSSEEEIHFDLIPVSSLDTRVKPQLAEAETRIKILETLADLSGPELSEQILTGKVVLPKRLASSREDAIMAE